MFCDCHNYFKHCVREISKKVHRLLVIYEFVRRKVKQTVFRTSNANELANVLNITIIEWTGNIKNASMVLEIRS